MGQTSNSAHAFSSGLDSPTRAGSASVGCSGRVDGWTGVGAAGATSSAPSSASASLSVSLSSLAFSSTTGSASVSAIISAVAASCLKRGGGSTFSTSAQARADLSNDDRSSLKEVNDDVRRVMSQHDIFEREIMTHEVKIGEPRASNNWINASTSERGRQAGALQTILRIMSIDIFKVSLPPNKQIHECRSTTEPLLLGK